MYFFGYRVNLHKLTWGWSQMKVGLMQFTSIKSPTILSNSLRNLYGVNLVLSTSHRTEQRLSVLNSLPQSRTPLMFHPTSLSFIDFLSHPIFAIFFIQSSYLQRKIEGDEAPRAKKFRLTEIIYRKSFWMTLGSTKGVIRAIFEIVIKTMKFITFTTKIYS